ncbi:hypothetical protein L5515_010417 [Caenorhabditis briggsae]|uniref:C2H2-type domain-containing protein n=1 Tax=Caenorhabditis briggsae TaxID=6238 RepID=A0AAE9JF19_CAEBR|nr:hypothetical protein L5515_010417 [Caenorhabditis briggsae]
MLWSFTGCRVELPATDGPELHAIEKHGMKQGRIFRCSCCRSIFSLASANRIHKKHMKVSNIHSDSTPLLHCSRPKGWNKKDLDSNLTKNDQAQNEVVQLADSLDTGIESDQSKALEKAELVEKPREKAIQEETEIVVTLDQIKKRSRL